MSHFKLGMFYWYNILVLFNIINHFFFIWIFIIKIIIFCLCFFVLLVFGYQIIHVAFSFSKFHFIHTFTSVPMQESFASEHGSELFRNAFENLLNGGGVSNEGGSH